VAARAYASPPEAGWPGLALVPRMDIACGETDDGLYFDQSNRPVESDRAVREVQASEAKTHLPQLLDDVERGETIVITRHGRPIARLMPDEDRRRTAYDEAVEGIMALRKRTGKVTLQEILDARHEGHKY
jgi:prevent-host-death family protein